MYIKDNVTGVVRLYGTDCHDSLEISDDGKYLTYYNLQCGEGSKYGSYSFVTDENGTLPKDNEDLIKHGAEAFFNIGGFDRAIQPLEYDDAKYHEEHGEVVIADVVWEDALKALQTWNTLFESYEKLTAEITESGDIKNATKRIDDWCISQLRGIISDYYADRIIDKHMKGSE